MPRFAANLSMLFTEAPLLERFERAARAGFAAVELQFPYDTPAEQLQQALFRNKLTLVLHNLPAGDWAAGERGIACHPDRVEEFRKGVDTRAGLRRRARCAAAQLPRRHPSGERAGRDGTPRPGRQPALRRDEARRRRVSGC